MGAAMASPSSLLPRPSQAQRAIGWAGLLAGSLDITAAFVVAGLRGRGPVSVLQGIAGGLLGISSFRGGLATAALGALFHFLITTTAAAVFYLASRKWKIPGKAGHSIRTAVRGCGLHLYVLFDTTHLRLSHENCASHNDKTY